MLRDFFMGGLFVKYEAHFFMVYWFLYLASNITFPQFIVYYKLQDYHIELRHWKECMNLGVAKPLFDKVDYLFPKYYHTLYLISTRKFMKQYFPQDYKQTYIPRPQNTKDELLKPLFETIDIETKQYVPFATINPMNEIKDILRVNLKGYAKEKGLSSVYDICNTLHHSIDRNERKRFADIVKQVFDKNMNNASVQTHNLITICRCLKQDVRFFCFTYMYEVSGENLPQNLIVGAKKLRTSYERLLNVDNQVVHG
jgi:hypothetical protein